MRNVWIDKSVARNIASRQLEVVLYIVRSGLNFIVENTEKPLKRAVQWKFDKDTDISGIMIFDNDNTMLWKLAYQKDFHSGDAFTVNFSKIELLIDGRKVLLGDVL